MIGAYLPGNSTVELRDAAVPEPGHDRVQQQPLLVPVDGLHRLQDRWTTTQLQRRQTHWP